MAIGEPPLFIDGYFTQQFRAGERPYGFVELDRTTLIPGLSVDHIGRLVFKHMDRNTVIQTDATDKVAVLIEQLAKELVPEQKD